VGQKLFYRLRRGYNGSLAINSPKNAVFRDIKVFTSLFSKSEWGLGQRPKKEILYLAFSIDFC
jgi:hypothetical protein